MASTIKNHADSNKSDPSADDRDQNIDDFTFSTDYDSSAAEDSFLTNYDSPEFALLAYARTDKLDKLRALLQAKRTKRIDLDLNIKGRQKQNFSWSALHLACYFGNVDIVRELLGHFNSEIDVNIQNNLGDTPLHKAALTQREDLVQLLLQYNADIFIRNSDGLTAKQVTNHDRITNLIEGAEQADFNKRKLKLLDAVINNNLEYVKKCISNYDNFIPEGHQPAENKPLTASAESADEKNDSTNLAQFTKPSLDLRVITDDRGNTPLHLASLRGHKAMCVLLLEKGLDARHRNHRGQTPIDLATPPIRHLLMNVKPADIQINKITKQSVKRFEGQLMKKVRFLGWRPIYAVIENGVFFIFNNRNDSMNKSRRGYKYLESAICEPDPVNIGVFSICFSDRSKVMLLIPASNVSSSPYSIDGPSTYKSVITNQTSDAIQLPSHNVDNVDLARQKWIDAINDHIRYSTEFIKKGLRLNEDDEEDCCGERSNLNQLLPLDTVASIFQEARAHQSILERHAESLASLIEKVIVRKANEEASTRQRSQELARASSSASQQPERPSSGGIISRMTSNYRYGRSQTMSETGVLARSPAESGDEQLSEFVQETWPTILFHLKLLIESSFHTKASLSQAMGLMEHQEHIRQQRLQDQEERCRVLEDSLHMLARDHHELEKSISTASALYNTAMARTISISTVNTDLNEYFDAFEDFDDEKTVTPSSMPSDDEVEDMPANMILSGSKSNVKTINQAIMRERSPANPNSSIPPLRINAEEDDDDNRSDCSALTMENDTEIGAEISRVSADIVGRKNRLAKKKNVLNCINDVNKMKPPIEPLESAEAMSNMIGNNYEDHVRNAILTLPHDKANLKY